MFFKWISMPSSRALRWLMILPVLAALPVHAFDMERDTWLLPEESASANTVRQDPMEFARIKADGNDQEPEYARGDQVKLIAAAGADDYKAVSLLLAKGVNPNLSADRWGDRALPRAVANGNVEMVRILLEAGADPELKGRGFTPLGMAALQGHVRIVRLLLKAGADVDRKSNDGNTPIIAATLMHRADAVRELLAYRPDMAIWNREGRVSLGIAVEQNDTNIVTMMLQAGVDPNLMDRNGNRPLFWAGDHQDIATMLVAHGGTSF
jgi:uncharacterized protein